MGTIRRFFQDGTNKKDTEKLLAEHIVGEKEVMLFVRIALEGHDFSDTRAERLDSTFES